MKTMCQNLFIAFLILTVFSGCKKDDHNISSSSPNILLIISDDVGKDAISGYTEGSIKPSTPNIDAIRTGGLVFNNFWAYPTCSPTRASIITGKYGYSTGVKWAGDVMSNSETVLHSYIKSGTGNKYAAAVIGKWHLAGDSDPAFNPESFGMDYYAGILTGGSPYYQWTLTEDGVGTNQNNYITEKFTDLSIDWVNAQDKPWFLWLAYTAPHTPFHTPPSEMHSQGALPEYTQGMDATPYYMAAIEAMDYQIGRLLDSMPADVRNNTIIIFIGDNGTPNQAAQSPYTSSTVKGTLYQGGINVPMFISGPGVSRTGYDDNMICSTDLFATIAEMAGISVPEIHDSRSFRSFLSDASASAARQFQYAEMNDGTSDLWTIRNSQYKIIANAMGSKEMYDLNADPYETNDLLNGTLTSEQTQGKYDLEAELGVIRN